MDRYDVIEIKSDIELVQKHLSELLSDKLEMNDISDSEASALRECASRLDGAIESLEEIL